MSTVQVLCANSTGWVCTLRVIARHGACALSRHVAPMSNAGGSKGMVVGVESEDASGAELGVRAEEARGETDPVEGGLDE